MMEAASTSETFVDFYQSTQRYKLEDANLHWIPVVTDRDWWRALVITVIYLWVP
jgi:hypothetical protein